MMKMKIPRNPMGTVRALSFVASFLQPPPLSPSFSYKQLSYFRGVSLFEFGFGAVYEQWPVLGSL